MSRKKPSDRRAGSIGERILFSPSPSGIKIEISQKIPKAQMVMLSTWLVMWGIVILPVIWLGFLGDESMISSDERIAYMVYAGFWSFFAFRIFKVWRWRRVGKEQIVISERGLSVAMLFGERGLPDTFSHGSFGSMERLHLDPRKLMQSFDHAFWSLGGATVRFKARGKYIQFGKQLNDRDADALVALVQREVKRSASDAASQLTADS